jgi:hypothetical protein
MRPLKHLSPMPTKIVVCLLGPLLCCLVLLPVGAAAASADAPYPQFRFDFGLIGDVPYDDAQETNYFPNMLEELNRADLAFVVHDGDIKAGETPCSDPLLERRYAQFQQVKHPFVYIFGDNEWSDCPRVENERTPEEWLERLRVVFCAGDQSLGQKTMRLERQSGQPQFASFRENVRWIHGGAIFVGINVPGSANNFGRPEFAARNAANISWINDAFALAAKHELQAIMLIMQANPHFDLASTNRLRHGFNEMLSVIEERTIAYGRPVMLVHGDSHYFRMDQPLIGRHSKRRIENFTRLETYGNPDVHWLKVTVDWKDPNVFVVQRQLVKKNFIRHQRQ